MAYQPQAQYLAQSIRPHNSAVPRENYPQEEYSEGEQRNTGAQGNGYPANYNDQNVWVQHRPAPNQQYQQQPQAWDWPKQQQAQWATSDEPSRNYQGLYQPQDGYAQTASHRSAQSRPLQGDHGRPNQNGNGVYSSQTPQQTGYSDQYHRHNGYGEERRTRTQPQRSHSDGSSRLPETADRSRTTPGPVQDRQAHQNKDRMAANAQLRSGPNKPTKVRILTEQTSPETLSWDNPFPTFPTKSKKMPQPSEADAPRPATASSNRSHDCAREQPRLRKGDRSTDDDRQPPLHDVRSDYTTAPISGLPPNIPRPVLEGARGFPMQLNAPSAQYAQASGEGMAGGNRPLRNGIPHLEANLKESHSVPASPWQSKYTPGIRNNVNSPSEIPEPMSHSSLPFRDNEHAVQQERDPRDQRGPPSNHNELHQRREEHHPRSTDTNRSQSLDLDRGYQGQIGQTYKPFPGPFATPDETNNRHLGSYHDWSNESQQMQYPQEARNNRSPGESDIPNFDALTNERAYQRPGMMMDQQLHLQPQTNPANTSSFKDGNGHGAQREQPVASNFSSQASRSRSQPNYKDRRHPNYAHGFEASNLTPPVAAFNGQSPMPHYNSGYMDPPPSQSQERPYYGTKQHSNISQRSFVKQQGTPQSPSHGLPVLQPTRSPDDRNEYPSASGSPANSFSPGISRGPTSPPHIDRPRLNPPIERVYASSASSMDLNRPDSIQSRRLSNPDSLPAHPAPIRPGLVSPPNSNQPKPPPVRQYNNISSPVLQSNVPQSQLRRSIGNADSRPVTHEELQRLQQAVKVNPNDQKTQLLLAQKMVEAASVLADEGGRADAKTRNKNREKYIFDAHKLVKKLVSGGYTEAMFYLADCHGSGLLGLQPDPKEAFSLYQSAAKLGHAPSAYRVAVCCEMGQEDGGGTRRDPLKAVQWYKRAATLGDTPAMYKMGMIQLKGLLGQPKNMRESIVWLKRAADHADAENPHALHELALLYESASPNDNIIRDEAYSAQLLLQAAELGYKFSQYRLGAAFEYGHLGRPIDPRQSIAWYSKAAVQEEHQSELALSGWYLTGSEGVLQQSDTEAYLWARKAAQAGLAKAEYAMGYFTEVGIGASANMDDAKRWYWRAASQHFPKARDRLEDLRKGGARMEKSRVSRSAVNKQSEGECSIM